MSSRHDTQVTAPLLMVEAQVEVSRGILRYAVRCGAPDVDLAGLDQLESAVTDARYRLLPGQGPHLGEAG